MSVSKVDKKKLNFGPVTAILAADQSTLLLSTQHTVYKYDLSSNTFTLFFTNCKSIPDMTKVDNHCFAFIDQGTWFSSSVCTFNARGKALNKFDTDTYCSGIAYYDGHYYLTFSLHHWLKYGDSGYIKVTDKKGYEKQTIENDVDGNAVFGRDISKLYVASDNSLYLADRSKKSFRVFSLLVNTGKVSLQTEFDHMVINDIIKRDGKLYLVLGGNKNEIVQIAGGSKKFLEQRHLEGEPTAACFVGQHIVVATKHHHWLLFWQEPEYFLQWFMVSQAFSDDHVVSIT